MAIHVPRREFVATLGSAVVWPLAALVSGAVVSVALATGAVAQKPTVPLNTLKAIEVALQACWIPPPINQARPGMQITVMMSFNRTGELFGQPKITFESVGASNDERLAYRIAVAQMLKRCTPLQFTDALGSAVAGRPFRMRLIDARKLKQVYRKLALSRAAILPRESSESSCKAYENYCSRNADKTAAFAEGLERGSQQEASSAVRS